jgi:hypothetical protein
VFLINVPIGVALVAIAMTSLTAAQALRREPLDLLGAGTGTAGLASTIYGIMQTADHAWGSARVLIPLLAGCASFVAGFGWLSQADAGSHYTASLLGPTLLVANGIGLVFPTLMASATADVRPGDVGIVGGLANTASQVGGSIALAVYATAAAANHSASALLEALAYGYELVFDLAAGVALAIAAGSLLLPARQRN